MSSESRKSKKGKNGGRREGSGRKPLKVTDEDRQFVEKMSGFGIPVLQIAALTCGGIGTEALYKYFSKNLIEGRGKRNAHVVEQLNKKIDTGDTTAIIFWLKTQAGFSEKHKHEITGEDGGPVKFTSIECTILPPCKVEDDSD